LTGYYLSQTKVGEKFVITCHKKMLVAFQLVSKMATREETGCSHYTLKLLDKTALLVPPLKANYTDDQNVKVICILNRTKLRGKIPQKHECGGTKCVFCKVTKVLRKHAQLKQQMLLTVILTRYI